MITLINFADKSFRSKQKWNSLTAKVFGKVNTVLEFSPKDIPKDFLDLNKESLKYSKGYGNYFWKPYIINKALKEIKEGDYLFYADSGSIFLKSILPLIIHLEKNNKKVLCFKLPLIEKQWTKRDAFILMNCDSKEFTDSNQILSGFILIKKCIETESFVENFLKYSLDYRILSDNYNELGLPNYPEFIAHRHDQSILSLLSKKNNFVQIEPDLSDYGFFPYKYIFNKDILYKHEMLDTEKNKFKGIVLCNRAIHPLKYFSKYIIKRIFLSLGFKI